MTADRPDRLPSLARVHVVLVEDDARFAHVLATVLECCGALVTTAPSLDAALRLLESVVPGVLVVGTRSAAGAAAWLATASRGSQRPPALAITTDRDDAAGQAVVPAGFQACLPRPIELGEFCWVVSGLAAERPGARVGPPRPPGPTLLQGPWFLP
jgi:DNA-binding response OmpR family regulator